MLFQISIQISIGLQKATTLPPKVCLNFMIHFLLTAPHSIILQYYGVTSKNIPSRGVRKENPPTSSFRESFIFRFHTQTHMFLYLCLISNASVQVIQSLDHYSRFIHEMLILYLTFCFLNLDLFSLSELDMSSRQFACTCLPCRPSFQSTLSYTFPNLSHPFQFSNFNLRFFPCTLGYVVNRIS